MPRLAPFVPKTIPARPLAPANDDVRKRAARSCVVCGDPASIGVGVFPLRGMAGDWYCAHDAPASNKRMGAPSERLNIDSLDNQPGTDKSHILHIENLVTGIVTEIDLRAPDKKIRKRKGPDKKIEWRRREEVQANLSPNALDRIFEVLKVQEYAEARNRQAVRAGSTDRYCRCGALADTAYRVKGNAELWRCDECI